MFAHVKVLSLAILLALSASHVSRAQTQDDSAAAQKATADKFLQLLLARPQPGTALDKTVEYYQSIGELDALSQRIKAQATEAQTAQPDVAARYWLTAALIAQSQTRWLESIELLRQAPDVAQHRWAVGQAQSIACEQLQRWSSTIDVLQPLIDQAIDQTGQTNAESVIEGARRLAKAYAQTGQSAKAIEVWRKLESRFGRDEQIAARLAGMAANEGELDFAVEVLDRILSGKLPATKRMELAIQRTGLIARAGHHDQAIASYEQLLTNLNADSWLASDIAQRIQDLIIGRDGVEALLDYYRAQLTKRPDDLNLMLRLATALDSEKRWDESNRLFKQLIDRTSTATAPRVAFAQSLIHQQRWPDAAAELAKLVELQPRNDDFIAQWCEAISADETRDAAQRDQQVRTILEKRYASSAPTATVYQQLAAHLQRFGLSQTAADWLAKAYELQSDDLSILSDYSRALLELGREPELLRVTSAFESAHHSDRDTLSQLADLYADLGFDDLAITSLSRACELGATSTMRFRLSDWYQKAEHTADAAEQLELAWKEIATQTQSPSEQESLCEEITRRQLQLATRANKLKERLAKLKTLVVSNPNQSPLAGLDAAAIMAWRIARFLVASGETELAYTQVSSELNRFPNSQMLWRLRAELDEKLNRYADAIEAHRKLAELDVRRRSEHLLAVAKALAQTGRVEAALQQAEAITTETASSQHIIDVFNLALDHHAEKFAINLLERRLLARPGDIEVLQRLIRYHLDKGAFERAATYQWQNLQLMRTPEQREAAVELLIETHVQLRSLNNLEQQLEKFWRRHDLWREFGLWQAMIALRSDNYLRAEQLLTRLAQSSRTRRFALENLLRLAESQRNNFKKFELMKQLASIDSQAITADAISKVLIDMPIENRSPQQAQDALALIRGSSKRLALIQDLIHAGSVDMALRVIAALPESEQHNWPVVCRAALLCAALPTSKDAKDAKDASTKERSAHDAADHTLPAHVRSAVVQMQAFTERSLQLSDTVTGQKMLEELLDSQKFIFELLTTTTCLRNSTSAIPSINAEATNCRSTLQAYQAVVAAQLQMADSPAERRKILARQQKLAMQQASPRERAARLAALAITANWHSKAPTFLQAAQDLERIGARQSGANAVTQESLIRKRLVDAMAAHTMPADTPLAARLAADGVAFQFVISDLTDLADQGDSLASLLCLWEMASAQHDLLQPSNAPLLKRASLYCQQLGDYAIFAPAPMMTLMATVEKEQHPNRSAEYLQTLSQMQIDRASMKRVMEMVLGKQDPVIIQTLVASRLGQSSGLELLGELAGGRDNDVHIKPADLWRALDYSWQSDVKQGLRSLKQLRPPAYTDEPNWMKALPQCSISMHQSSLFHVLDFSVARAIMVRAHSVIDRQELLKMIKQLADEPADNDLRLVRQLAQVFVLELLEQDSQSSQLLDKALPPDSSAASPSTVVMRGLWLDIIGKHDAAIEWWLKFHEWPDDFRESTAALLLRLSMGRHHDKAIDVAVKELRSVNKNLAAYHSLTASLIERDLLPQAETLLGEFQVLLPPSSYPLVLDAQILKVTGPQAEIFMRWRQTDLLFELLQKHAQADDKEAFHRIARRLLGGLESASDDEFREHLSHFALRFKKAFKNAEQLAEFLEEESHRVDPVTAPRHALCSLRLSSDMGFTSLAQGIAERMASHPLTAVQYLELARCQLKLNPQEAAVFFARAFELQPDWVDSILVSLNERSQTVVDIATEMNKRSNAAAGVGVAGVLVFMRNMTSSELAKLPQLWIGWAGNSRAKSLDQMRLILRHLRSENFELWNSVVEQLLLTDELQPVTAAFDSADHWVTGSVGNSYIQSQLLDSRMNARESSLYRAMLERVIAKSSDPFLARLLLANSYLVTDKVNAAAEQLPSLLRSVSRGAVKPWLVNEWRSEMAKRQVNSNNRAPLAAVLNQTSKTFNASEIDKAARAKLLLELLNRWDRSPEQLSNRVSLAEAIMQLNGLTALSDFWQQELLKQYAVQQDEAKVLAIFEPEFQRMQTTHKLTAPISSEWLNVLATNGMDWQRQLIVIRAAQLERLPLHFSTAYLDQLKKAGDANAVNPQALIYPSPHASQFLERLLSESRKLLPAADWNSSNANPWCECFKPQIAIDPIDQSLDVVSMLDALWPAGETPPADILASLNTQVHGWSKDLESLGAWQTLALHDWAARLGNESLVKRVQQRLLELAKSKTTPADRPWRLACWSAVKSSHSMASVSDQRFSLGEVARNAAAEYGSELNSVYILMTVAQFDKVKHDAGLDQERAAEKMADEVISLVRNSQAVRAVNSRGIDAINSQIKINLVLFEKLVTKGNADLAIDLLHNMCANNLIVGTAGGLTIPAANDHNPLGTFDVLSSFQHMIDQGTETARLQSLLEDLLLKPFTGEFRLGNDFPGLNTISAERSKELTWDEAFDARQPLGKLVTPRNMYSQLVETAAINNSLSTLNTRLLQDPEKRPAHVICGVLVALKEGKVADALSIYRQLVTKKISVSIRDQEINIIRDAIFNAVSTEPLSDAAISYSSISLQRPLNAESLGLLRQQFLLATAAKRNGAVENLLLMLGEAHQVPLLIRDSLRVEYALELLAAQRIRDSLLAYSKARSKSDKAPTTPDRYVLAFLNRLPSLGSSEQADVFNCFLSDQALGFPWLDCYALPALQAVPRRLRNSNDADGLVFNALEMKRAWVGCLSWIVDYAQRTGQSQAAIEAATAMTVSGPEATWGAAAVTASLDSRLTPAALKNRLASTSVRPTLPSMQALMDCCASNEALRATAVEVILNLGVPSIALASPTSATPPAGWKHWLVVREETFAASNDVRPRWTLDKKGQWTAHSSSDAWYLMLRYPIERDFQIKVTAQQVSGSKFGVGVGGIAIAQHGTDPSVRCLGTGQRRPLDQLLHSQPPDDSAVPLCVQRQGSDWLLQAAAASYTETADDIVPFIYLVNQGPGTARLENWQSTEAIKIARQADLLDSQLRMWRVTLGSWKLPPLRRKSAELESGKSELLHVAGETLRLPQRATSMPGENATRALHCLRVLMPDETVSYEFYASTDTAVVHPALGRMAFRCDGQSVRLQWLQRSDDKKWLGLADDQLFALEPAEMKAAVKILPDAWNKVAVTLAPDKLVTLRLNNEIIAQVALPDQLRPEFGLLVSSPLPAKVRHVELSGDWPDSLSQEQLQE